MILNKKKTILTIVFSNGAGSGNRTHLSSLEGWSISRYTIPACGAEDGTRTRNIHLGKVALYQLNYVHHTWCVLRDSNSWPTP